MAGAEPGSFRDRDSRVVVTDDAVLRALSARGAADWEALAASPLLERLVAKGELVGTEEVSPTEAGLDRLDGEGELIFGGVEKVLRHQRIPFVSYPYEWTFGMLKDAALLQLELGIAAVEEGLTLKDATPYNVQFRGSRPTFIDVGSFERLREGEPWAGYRQFCMLYLFPLMFTAYKDIPYHPWLRGSIDGISPIDARSVFSFRDKLRRGVLVHVALQGRLERRAAKFETAQVKKELKVAFTPDMIKANLRKLHKIVSRMTWRAGETAWTGYRQQNTYTDEDAAAKQTFVREAAAELSPRLTWDMGCNDGAYARIAAESSGQVVAFDYDHATVEALYRSLKAEGETKILPLVGNLADPSPGLGWRGLERRTLVDRGVPDLMMALALIHHVSITANIPLADFLEWARELGPTLLIEFPKREDPMVQTLLAGKHEGANADYGIESFERELGERFEVARRQELPSGTRVMYLARPRRSSSGRV